MDILDYTSMSREEKENYRKWLERKRLERGELLFQRRKERLERKKLQRDIIKAWKIINQSKKQIHFIHEFFAVDSIKKRSKEMSNRRIIIRS
jgi:hypothetical protein